MTSGKIFNLSAAEFVRVNNFGSFFVRQSPTIDTDSRHVIEVVAVLNHRKRFRVQNVHSAKLIGDDGKFFVHAVAQEKFFRATNVRAIFFVETAQKTSEHAISRNHQFLSTVNNAFDGQR